MGGFDKAAHIPEDLGGCVQEGTQEKGREPAYLLGSADRAGRESQDRLVNCMPDHSKRRGNLTGSRRLSKTSNQLLADYEAMLTQISF